jgi:hypothetical protein
MTIPAISEKGGVMSEPERERVREAAPELLEALEGIEHFADGFHVYHRDSPAGHALREWIDAARTAIRKARGE